MQNIDLVYAAQPLIIVIIVFLMIIYYWRKSQFTKWVLLYSFLAYVIAILAKVAIQLPSISAVEAANNLYLLGIYFGLQTVFLEVGLAYLFARYAVSKGHLELRQGSSYGTGLAFWENGVYLGLLSLVNLLTLFAILGSGMPEAQTIYNILIGSEPALFYPPLEALPIVALGILERISSIIVHFAWGYLCVVAAVTGKKKYLAVALPMGFLDFFVVFVNVLTIYGLEALIFVWAIVSLAVAKYMTKGLQKLSQYESVGSDETGSLTSS